MLLSFRVAFPSSKLVRLPACRVRLDGLENEIPTVLVDPLPPDLERIANVSWGLAWAGLAARPACISGHAQLRPLGGGGPTSDTPAALCLLPWIGQRSICAYYCVEMAGMGLAAGP
jgi:hypothetical protein